MRRSRLLTAVLAIGAAVGLATPAGAATHNVTSRDFVFEPSDLTIEVGDTVVWTNNNTVNSHNVVANDGSFNSGSPKNGNWTFSHTFNTPGDFRYFCQPHGSAAGFGMVGIVRVQGGGTNDQPGNLRFASANFNVDEGNTATITVQRVGGDDGAVSVSFATSNGTASAEDYQPRSGTLSWADNDDSPKTFQVPTTEDGLAESDETINVLLSNPSGGAGLGAPAGATITIRDDDVAGTPGQLSFAAATQTASEGDGEIQLVVRRTGGTTGAVSVRVMTHEGTATGGLDFADVDQVVTFAAGDAVSKTVTVPILDDLELEPTETFHAMLTAPTGGAALADPSLAAIQIADDDVDAGPCVEDVTTLCLVGDRFRVTAEWRTGQGTQGAGNAVELTGDTGYFWFFDEDNVEVVVKVLNACVPPFDRFWVFASGLTDVEVQLRVTDTQRPAVQTYTNDLGTPFQPIQDTQAFATCP